MKRKSKYLLSVILSFMSCVAVYSQPDKAQQYLREAEAYNKQAEGYEREAQQLTEKANGYTRQAESYAKKNDYSQSCTYTNWANEALQKAQLRLAWAKEAREKAQMRMRWAEDAMKRK
jgi:hypothetical protein